MNPFEEHKEILNRIEPGSAERCNQSFRPIFPDLVDHVVSDIYGFAYSREQIAIKTRQLLTLAILSTMGDCNIQLKFHLRAALHLGLQAHEIKEVFVQVAVLAGNVRAINAASIFFDLQTEIAQQCQPTD
ncbi:carboxymuconolactone decarboxylase family protein [Janthinobacterium fluminis]|uniref:Carboxymuconolactone decarboxylase family protein n=1 Tax=Janthinobacterium fluminis TaxID=2987524 RepID=A0ABT5JX60_9BURK|nr:carboxymuconolactone decarboxylase family protein [Janthinobacterium fluminis]MDC8757307.1 carboxymuconolactone decarboxylase family protein [Janthinobacterium fluminis]